MKQLLLKLNYMYVSMMRMKNKTTTALEYALKLTSDNLPQDLIKIRTTENKEAIFFL